MARNNKDWVDVKIRKEIYQKASKYCKDEGIYIYRFIEKLIEEKTEKNVTPKGNVLKSSKSETGVWK